MNLAAFTQKQLGFVSDTFVPVCDILADRGKQDVSKTW